MLPQDEHYHLGITECTDIFDIERTLYTETSIKTSDTCSKTDCSVATITIFSMVEKTNRPDTRVAAVVVHNAFGRPQLPGIDVSPQIITCWKRMQEEPNDAGKRLQDAACSSGGSLITPMQSGHDIAEHLFRHQSLRYIVLRDVSYPELLQSRILFLSLQGAAGFF